MINYYFANFLTLGKHQSSAPHLKGGPHCFDPASTLHILWGIDMTPLSRCFKATFSWCHTDNLCTLWESDFETHSAEQRWEKL